MSNKDFDKQLDSLIEALPQKLSPKRDLWSGIEHSIEMHPRSSKHYWITGVAACFVFVFAGFLFVYPHAQVSNDSVEQNSSNLALQDLDKGFEIQRTAMMTRFENTQAHTSNWKEQMQELADARTALVEALASDPGNPFLLSMLKKTYSQELSLIESVHQQPTAEFNL